MRRRRLMPRYHKRLEVLINYSGKLWHRGSTLDFGPSGLCLTCADLPVLSSMLHVQVLLPDGRAIRMLATPVWDVDDRQLIGSRDRRKLGLEINAAPEAWYHYCHSLDRVFSEPVLQPALP